MGRSRTSAWRLAVPLVAALHLGAAAPGAAASHQVTNVVDGVSRTWGISIDDGIPAAEKIRGAISMSRWNPMTSEGQGSADLHEFIVENRLATIDYGFRDDVVLADAEYRSEWESLIQAFTTLGATIGRPELDSVGFILHGCSVHGSMSMAEGLVNPERTIAVVSFCGRDYALFEKLPQLSAFMPQLSYPHLQVSNGGDLDRVLWNDDAVRRVRREARGLWTHALHPRLGHCEVLGAPDHLGFELLWLAEVLRVRLPAVIPAGAYALNPLADSAGWLGQYGLEPAAGDPVWGSGYRCLAPSITAAATVPSDQVGDYTWLPTQRAAQQWETYCRTGAIDLSLPEPDGGAPDGPAPPRDAGTDAAASATDAASPDPPAPDAAPPADGGPAPAAGAATLTSGCSVASRPAAGPGVLLLALVATALRAAPRRRRTPRSPS